MANIEPNTDTITISDVQLLEATEPGQLRVIRRDGTIKPYDANRIATAMKKAFLAVEGDNAAHSERIQDIVAELTAKITDRLQRRWPSGGTVHIETIQDLVELALMRAGEHQVARSYVIYREARRQERLKFTKKLDAGKRCLCWYFHRLEGPQLGPSHSGCSTSQSH